MFINKKNLLQRAAATVFLGVFLLYGWLASDIQLDVWASSDVFTTRTFPYLIAAGGSLVSLLYLLQPTVFQPPPIDRRAVICVAMVALLWTYSYLVEWLGYPVASLLMLVSGFLLLGERRPFVIVAIAGGVVLGLYGLLSGLGIHIDPGEPVRAIQGWLT